MRASRKAMLIVLFLAVVGIFGYSQYIAVSHIGVIVTENEFLEKNNSGSIYNIQLQFSNPSLLILNAGDVSAGCSVGVPSRASRGSGRAVAAAVSKTTVKG